MALSRRQYTDLFATTLCNFAQFGARVVISPFVLAIATTFAVTKTDIGLVLTMLWGVFALAQFPSGVLADRHGERTVITISLTLAAVGSFAVAVAPSFIIFTAAAVLLGLGTGLYFSVGASLISKRFETHQSQALAVHSAGGPFSGVMLPVIATVVAVHSGWRMGVVIGVGITLVALVVMRVSIRSHWEQETTRIPVRETIGRFLKRPSVVFTTVVATAGMYAFQSVVSFFPTFLQEYHRLTGGTASLWFSVMFLLTALILPLVGRLADKYGLTTGITGPMILAGLSLVALLTIDSMLIVGLGTAGIGAGLTWGGAVQSRFMRRFDANVRSANFGLGRTLFVFLGATGNVCTGYLSQHYGWAVGYGVVAGVLFLTAGAVIANRQLGCGL